MTDPHKPPNVQAATLAHYQAEEQRLHGFVERLLGRDEHPAVQVLSRPKQLISGDFYCLQATDDKLYALLADGMGHGLAAVLSALDLPRTFRELAAREFGLVRIADALNALLYQRGLSGYFVAMSLVCLDARQQRIDAITAAIRP